MSNKQETLNVLKREIESLQTDLTFGDAVLTVLGLKAEERIIPFWYRGTMHIEPVKGNGKGQS